MPARPPPPTGGHPPSGVHDATNSSLHNLENLRKQAKELLRQVRARNGDALTRVQEHHHRFTDTSESESRFRLQDAHLVVAREHGFASWPKLVAACGSESRTDGTTRKGYVMPTRFAFPAQLIALVLSKETAAAQAIALCRLEPGLAAAIFKSYSEDIQEQVIIRITTIASEGAQAITELEQASTPELKAILLNELVGGLDGMQTTARLLRHLSRERETAILQAIRKQDSDLADAVQEHRELVTFADMEHLTDREIQLVLGEIDIRDLAVALKGVSEKLMDRLLANVSESDREVVADEMKYSGPVRITDVEEVQRRIAKTVQALEEKNEVATLRGEPHRFV